jgi:hypothetical protein
MQRAVLMMEAKHRVWADTGAEEREVPLRGGAVAELTRAPHAPPRDRCADATLASTPDPGRRVASSRHSARLRLKQDQPAIPACRKHAAQATRA